MTVGLRVFEQGRLILEDANFALVELNKTCEVSEATCPALNPEPGHAERLVVVECSLEGNNSANTFSQEHQLIYENADSGFSSSLLYDQRPVPSTRPPSPIILIAPKIWIAKRINTFIAFASASECLDQSIEGSPIEITVFSQSGEVVTTCSKPKLKNSTWILDVRKLLGERVTVSLEPSFFTLVARGGAGAYAITTFVVNEASGTFALEHSLPPPYYVAGDIARVRNEANRFSESTAKGEIVVI